MTTIRLSEFNGTIPRRNAELLGEFQAQTAINCNLLDGKLAAWADRQNITAVASGVKSVLRHEGYWITFADDVSAIPSPIAGDLVGRLYYSGDGAPRMTDLSKAIIGDTNILTTDGTARNVPHTYEARTAIAGLGIVIGDTLNASAQIQATGGDLVGGAVQIIFYDVGNAVLATFTGSLLDVGAEYEVSLLTSVVVPANTTQLSVGTIKTSGTGVTCRYCYLTKGAFTQADYPVASDILGTPIPVGAPTIGRITPACNITGATIQTTALTTSGGGVSIDSGGQEVSTSGTWKFSGSSSDNDSGHVTVNLLIDGTIEDSQSFAVSVHGSSTEARDYAFSGKYTLKGAPDTGAHTYTLTITTDVGTGSFSPTKAASGTIAQSGSVDLTMQPWVANTVKSFKDVITDSNGGIQIVYNAGTTKTGAHPVWGTDVGDLTTDGTVTWYCLGNWGQGSPSMVNISGVKGMTSINGNTSVVEVQGNVITVHQSTTQAYKSGGSMFLNLSWTDDGSANAVDTSYCYTYVSNLDGLEMEGAPSSPTRQLTMFPNSTLTLGKFPVTPSGYGITKLRLYRVVTGSTGVGAFTFVADVATSDGATPDTYFDGASDSQLSGVLATAAFDPPPVDMQGIRATPNGVVVGFHNNEVVLSEPYFPHTYPIDYRQSTKFDIMATVPCGGDSIAILTQGKPAMLTGRHPADMSMEEVNLILPCLSTDSAVDMGFGVLYATPTGLATISTSGAQVITRGLWSAKDWNTLNPSSMRAARYNDQYVCFYDATGIGGAQGGFIYNPNEPEASLTFLDFYATALWDAPATGDLYMIVADVLVKWDGGNGKLSYTWRSAENITPEPVNLGVAKVRASTYPVTFKLFADGVQKLSYAVPDANVFRLPSGYMATTHSVQLEGTAEVYEVIASENMAELRRGTSSIAESQRVVG